MMRIKIGENAFNNNGRISNVVTNYNSTIQQEQNQFNQYNNNIPFNTIKNDIDELSIDNIESDKNNSFINSFKQQELNLGYDNCIINYFDFIDKTNFESAFNIKI